MLRLFRGMYAQTSAKRKSQARRLLVEELCTRAVPSSSPVTLSSTGSLVIRGTLGDDTVTVALDDKDSNQLDVFYNDASTPFATFDLSQTPVKVIYFSGSAGNDYFANFTAINSKSNGGSGNDTLLGGAGDDKITGSYGDDSISGGDGNDTISGGSGNDVLSGDNGNDSVHGGTGDDSILGGDGDDLLWGDSGNDNIDGGDGNEMIYGGSGNDWLQGGIGNDWITGNTGNDTINGGLGDDTCNGAAGSDEVGGGVGDDQVIGNDGTNQTSLADYWVVLTARSGEAIGTAEILTSTDADGTDHADIQIVVVNAQPNATFDVQIDVNGDGTNVVQMGQFVTDGTGSAEFDVSDPPNMPALQDGISAVEVTSLANGGSDDLRGTIANLHDNWLGAPLAPPHDDFGITFGTAALNTNLGRLQIAIQGMIPNTTFMIYVNGDASTGTYLGQFTTDANGNGQFEIASGVIGVTEGSMMTIANVDGLTAVSGTFAVVSGDDGK